MRPLTIDQVWGDFLSLFYPNCCSGCYGALVKGEEILCSKCILEMPQTFFHLDPDNPLKRRLSGRLPIKQAWAFLRFSKNGTIQHLLHTLKYRNRPEIGVLLGKVYGQRIRNAGISCSFDAIVPVPLHPTRVIKRGYNQSEKFGEGLSMELNAPVRTDLLFRRSRTETQTRKSKLSRWENVAEVFESRVDQSIYGKHLLLVDDVITTGATVEACGQALVGQLKCDISVASIATA